MFKIFKDKNTNNINSDHKKELLELITNVNNENRDLVKFAMTIACDLANKCSFTYDETIINGIEVYKNWTNGKANAYEADIISHALHQKGQTTTNLIKKNIYFCFSSAVDGIFLKEQAINCTDYVFNVYNLVYKNNNEEIISNERKKQIELLKHYLNKDE